MNTHLPQTQSVRLDHNSACRDLARCLREAAEAEAMLRAGEPREDALLVWYGDQLREAEMIWEEASGRAFSDRCAERRT